MFEGVGTALSDGAETPILLERVGIPPLFEGVGIPPLSEGEGAPVKGESAAGCTGAASTLTDSASCWRAACAAACIAATRSSEVWGFDVFCTSAAAGVPQTGQNFAVGVSSSPQFAQVRFCAGASALAPQFVQNLAPSASGEPQLVQFICIILSYADGCYDVGRRGYPRKRAHCLNNNYIPNVTLRQHFV